MKTSTARQLASELRQLADSLDANPDVVIDHPVLASWCDDKETFLNFARLMPRPLKKRTDTIGSTEYIVLEYAGDGFSISHRVPKSLTCTLVEPAKPAVYKCDPILSDEEEESL